MDFECYDDKNCNVRRCVWSYFATAHFYASDLLTVQLILLYSTILMFTLRITVSYTRELSSNPNARAAANCHGELATVTA